PGGRGQRHTKHLKPARPHRPRPHRLAHRAVLAEADVMPGGIGTISHVPHYAPDVRQLRRLPLLCRLCYGRLTATTMWPGRLVKTAKLAGLNWAGVNDTGFSGT